MQTQSVIGCILALQFSKAYVYNAYIYNILYYIIHVTILANYKCVTVFPVLFNKSSACTHILWEASKVYSGISSHCMNLFQQLYL